MCYLIFFSIGLRPITDGLVTVLLFHKTCQRRLVVFSNHVLFNLRTDTDEFNKH
jgi:hypothetical protein